MKPVRAVDTIRPNLPDDLVLTCVGFEDRCLALPAFGNAFRARKAGLIRFRSSTKQRALQHKKDMNTQTLQRYLGARVDSVEELTPERYNPLALNLELEQLFGVSDEDLRFITIDISCFTRIQLLYVLKWVVATPGRTVRLLYAPPAYYGSLDNKNIAVGFDGLLFMPFLSQTNQQVAVGPNIFMLAGLGHEGARSLLAWNALEPSRTVLILPDNGRSPDVTRITERQNAQLIERAEAGDPTFFLHRLDPFSLSRSIRVVASTLEEFELRDSKSLITIVPGGPKPIVAAFALAAFAMSISCHVAYPLVSGYDPAYSTGIGGMFEHRIRTPFTLSSRSRAASTSASETR